NRPAGMAQPNRGNTAGARSIGPAPRPDTLRSGFFFQLLRAVRFPQTWAYKKTNSKMRAMQASYKLDCFYLTLENFMTTLDPGSWIGRKENFDDNIDVGHVRRIALSLNEEAPGEGGALPLL